MKLQLKRIMLSSRIKLHFSNVSPDRKDRLLCASRSVSIFSKLKLILARYVKIYSANNLDFLPDSDIMKGIICLHALVLSADAVVSYGIQAAIGKVITVISLIALYIRLLKSLQIIL